MARTDNVEGDPAGGVHPLLWHEGRARLLDCIESNAGVCASELSLRAGIDRNTAKYHLKRLVHAGLVTRRREGRRTHFFPSTVPSPEVQTAVVGAQGETRRRILHLVHAQPDLSWRAVGRHLGITARAVRWHLERLERTRLIQVDRSTARRRVHMTPTLEAVLRGDLTPTTGGRPAQPPDRAPWQSHAAAPGATPELPRGNGDAVQS